MASERRGALLAGAIAFVVGLSLVLALVLTLATGPTGPGPSPSPTPGPRLPPPERGDYAPKRWTPLPAEGAEGPPLVFAVEQVEPPNISVLLRVKVTVRLKASVANRGGQTAHRVEVRARARLGNDYLPINGADPFVVYFGDIPPGGRVWRPLTLRLEIGLTRAQRAQSEGVDFEVELASREGVRRLSPIHCTLAGCTGGDVAVGF